MDQCREFQQLEGLDVVLSVRGAAGETNPVPFSEQGADEQSSLFMN